MNTEQSIAKSEFNPIFVNFVEEQLYTYLFLKKLFNYSSELEYGDSPKVPMWTKLNSFKKLCTQKINFYIFESHV